MPLFSYIPTLTGPGYGPDIDGHPLLVGLGRAHAVTAHHQVSLGRGLQGSEWWGEGEGHHALRSKAPKEYRGQSQMESVAQVEALNKRKKW